MSSLVIVFPARSYSLLVILKVSLDRKSNIDDSLIRHVLALADSLIRHVLALADSLIRHVLALANDKHFLASMAL